MILQNNLEQEKSIPIEQYLKLQQEFADKEKKIEERLWLDNSVSEFDNVLRLNYNKSTKEFSKIVLDYIAELTKSYVGVFYIFDQERQVAQAIAGYACIIEKLSQASFESGEGVVGQAIESKKIIFFENLPAKNIEVKSSTLNIGAASIIIIPLVFNDRAYGVLELVFLRNLETKYYQLLEIVSRNIGAMLESVTNNELTKQLLLQSKEQTESLRAQEEELRQNMEELQATQELIQQKNIEIESKMSAINESGIASIEFELDSTILDANDTFLKIFGYQKEEIIGKKHQMFVSKEAAQSADYQELWDKLRQGIAQSGEFQRFGKDDNEIYVMGAYSVIKDLEGKPQKIFKLVTDISHTKKLLIESQAQSEALRAQEEELRQNMEELQATQELIQQKNLEIENKMNAINESGIASIEFDLNSTILDANDAFLNLMGYKKEEIIGKKHQMFVSNEYASTIEYQNFWRSLNQGIAQSGEFQRFGKNGKEVYVIGAYSIIKDSVGNPQKIFKLVTDITKLKKA